MAKGKMTQPPKPKIVRKPVPAILRPGNMVLLYFQEFLNKIFHPSLNPLYVLGSITFFLLWIIIGSGLYLYLFYDISATRAYTSIQDITENQKYYGGIMRSFHRYASDAFVLAILLHIIQVFFSDRFRKNRWVAWVSGAAVLIPVWLDGVTGYFLVWDEKGRMVAQITSRIMDVLPVGTEPMSRNFLTADSVHFLLLFVITYLHISIPFLFIALLWIHCMRVSRPNVNPPAVVGWTVFASLLALSLIKPAVSMGQADLTKLLGEIDMDWFYFAPFYMISHLGVTPKAAWLGGAASLLLFTALPWLIPDPKKADGEKPSRNAIPRGRLELDIDKCVGCMLCLEACPFEAVDIISRPGASASDEVVGIVYDRCAECGFCVTSCDYSAISMGGMTNTDYQKKIEDALFSVISNGRPRIMTFICERSLEVETITSNDGMTLAAHPSAAVLVTPCIGVVSPAMVEHSKRAGAEGVAVVGCRPLDCHYRETRRKASKDQATQFLVEEMKDPNLKVLLLSTFDAPTLIHEIGEFMDQVKSGPSQAEGDKR
jgi:ferredoxin